MNFVAKLKDTAPHRLYSTMGNTETVTIDLSKLETELGESIVSCDWSVDGGSISNEALALSKASADITTNQTGSVLVKVTCNATRQKEVIHILARVTDPQVSTTDYC